jgi:hypothetical protein
MFQYIRRIIEYEFPNLIIRTVYTIQLNHKKVKWDRTDVVFLPGTQQFQIFCI